MAQPPYTPPEFALFPPFYTSGRDALTRSLQPNPKTRRQQLELWCLYVLEFCRYHRRPVMTDDEFAALPIFHSDELQRRAHRVDRQGR